MKKKKNLTWILISTFLVLIFPLLGNSQEIREKEEKQGRYRNRYYETNGGFQLVRSPFDFSLGIQYQGILKHKTYTERQYTSSISSDIRNFSRQINNRTIYTTITLSYTPFRFSRLSFELGYENPSFESIENFKATQGNISYLFSRPSNIYINAIPLKINYKILDFGIIFTSIKSGLYLYSLKEIFGEVETLTFENSTNIKIELPSNIYRPLDGNPIAFSRMTSIPEKEVIFYNIGCQIGIEQGVNLTEDVSIVAELLFLIDIPKLSKRKSKYTQEEIYLEEHFHFPNNRAQILTNILGAKLVLNLNSVEDKTTPLFPTNF